MSAKCKFTIKMEPLVLGIRSGSLDEKSFFEALDKYFEDSKDLAERYWMGGNSTARPITPADVLAERLGQSGLETVDGSARDAYSGDDAGYKSMKLLKELYLILRLLNDLIR